MINTILFNLLIVSLFVNGLLLFSTKNLKERELRSVWKIDIMDTKIKDLRQQLKFIMKVKGLK